MNSGSTSNLSRNQKLFRVLSYVLVFLMMACVVLTISHLIQNVVPGWHSGLIAGALLFIVMDRLYTYRQLKSLTPLSSEWAIALGAQWVLIVLVIRFLLSYASGLNSFIADLSLFARGYLANFFSPEFVITFLLALLVWVLTAQFLDLLEEIGLDQELALHEESAPIRSDIVPAHQRLVTLIFSVGIFLVIVTVLTRINVQTILSNLTGLPDVQVSRFSGAEAGALLYFVFGLTLLSLSRLMSLQTHWNRLRIPISSHNLTRQWALYSLSFLLILAVAVSLLPAGDSLGLFSVLGTLAGFLMGILAFLAQLTLALVLLLFSLPFLLFGSTPPFLSRSAPLPLPTLPTQPVLPTETSAIWELIRSVLLWGALIVILVFAFIQFVRQHGGIRAVLRKSRITNWLILAWQWLSGNVDKTRGSLSRAIGAGWRSIVSRLEGKGLLPGVNFISLRSLDPRRQVYFFYLALVRRGGEQGMPRKPAQTPAEYAAALEKALPSATEDIDSITAAFVEARYSRQEISSVKAELVRGAWARIRRALQNRSKNQKSENQ